MSGEVLQEKLSFLAELSEMRLFRVVRGSMGVAGALILPASVLLLLAHFPVPGWDALWSGVFGPGWQAPLDKGAQAVYRFFALMAAFGAAHTYVKDAGEEDALVPGFLGMAAFLTLVPWQTGDLLSTTVGFDMLPMRYLGAEGLFGAIAIGYFTGWCYTFFQHHGLPFTVPDTVPDGVKGTFRSLVPGTLVLLIAAILSGLLAHLDGAGLPAIIDAWIQEPLQRFVDTPVVGAIIFGLAPLLFWCGLHGPGIVGTFTDPMLTANALANQQILDLGGQLAGNPVAHIVTQQIGVYATMGGCGLGLGFLVACFIGARSQQMRSILSLGGIPALFNINEPIIFGAPIVCNPFFLVPFTLAPVIAFLMTYAAIATGFMPPFTAIEVPWCMPPILSGFLLAGVRGAIVQAACIAAAAVIYLPFIIAQDNEYQKEERAAAEEDAERKQQREG